MRLRSSSSSTGGAGAASASSFARQLLTPFPGALEAARACQQPGAIAFWRRVLGGFAPYTEAPLGHADGIERIEQRFVVS